MAHQLPRKRSHLVHLRAGGNKSRHTCFTTATSTHGQCTDVVDPCAVQSRDDVPWVVTDSVLFEADGLSQVPSGQMLRHDMLHPNLAAVGSGWVDAPRHPAGT